MIAETDWNSVLTGVSVSKAAANFSERYLAGRVHSTSLSMKEV